MDCGWSCTIAFRLDLEMDTIAFCIELDTCVHNMYIIMTGLEIDIWIMEYGQHYCKLLWKSYQCKYF